MWRIQPSLTVACLSVTIGLWWVTHYYSGRLRPGYLRNRELYDNLVLLFTESVRGMQTIKGFAAEPHQIRRFEEANGQVSSQQQKRIFRDLSLFTPVTQMLSQLSLVILFAYGGWLYVQGRIPLGSGLVVFAGLLQQFNGQVANITTIANSVQQSFTAARRVFEVLDTPLEVQNRPNAIVPARLTGRMAFEGVTFGYHAGGKPVLEEVSFEAEPGQVVGIFGMTGAGKSSLLSLIPRFYDPAARAHPGGRAGPARPGPGRLPAADRHRVSGELSVFEHGGGQHRVRPSARDAGADRAGRADRVGARVHHGAAAWVRDGAGRIGRGPVRRPAAAAGAGAGACCCSRRS